MEDAKWTSSTRLQGRSGLWTRTGVYCSRRRHQTEQFVQGVRQGDPLSPLLFALVWQIVIDQSLTRMRTARHTRGDIYSRTCICVEYRLDTVADVESMLMTPSSNSSQPE